MIGSLLLIGAVVYLACIFTLTIFFQLVPKKTSKVKFILFSALSFTTPIFIALPFYFPLRSDITFFLSMPIIFTFLNGVYGAFYYHRFFRKSE